MPVNAAQIIPASNISNLTFTPEADANRNGYDSFAFTITDDGGTLRGGIDTDQLANNININVTGVNDPLAGTDKAITLAEDSAYTFTDTDFGFSDIENDAFNAVIINSIPATGSLTLSGTCLLYTSPSPRDKRQSRMPSSA